MTIYVDIHIWKNLRIRKFDLNVNSDDLIWHRDKHNRLCIVLSGSNWMFQMDNNLPIELSIGDTFYIQKERYHRIIKGSTPLILMIKEFENEHSNEVNKHFNKNNYKTNS